MIRWLLPFASAALAASVPVYADEGSGYAATPVASSLQATLALKAMTIALPQKQTQRLAAMRPVASPGTRAEYGRYGPFRVVGLNRVEMVGATDRATPERFAAMLRDFPGIRRIDMVECPGTHDDRANLRLGRMIRAAGIATHVPANGSVRSGAVDLFLAGRERMIANGAEFAVHSWRDPQGREARDFAPDAAPNRNYLDYYREMGMDAHGARAFYDFTNSVPHRQARWLEAGEMRAWMVRAGGAPRLAAEQPRFAQAVSRRPAHSAITQVFATKPREAGSNRRMAHLDVSVLDRTSLSRSHPAMAMLDSARRL